MKMRIIYCALFCLMAPTSVILAQDAANDNTPPPPPPMMTCPQFGPQCGMQQTQRGFCPRQKMGQRHHKGNMLNKMKRDLNLSDEQVQAMQELQKTMAQKRKKAMRQAMESVKTAHDAELKKILTEEQFRQFTEKRDQMRSHMKNSRKGHGGQHHRFGPPPLCEKD